MQRIELAYGRGTVPVLLPETGSHILTEREPVDCPHDETDLLRRALAAPVGSERLSRLVQPGQKLAIVVSDVTRPVPTARMLPALLDELALAGTRDEDLRIIVGLGGHRAQTPAEMAQIVGVDVLRRIHCENLGCDFVDIGRTRRGTPVQVYHPVWEADWRIYTGNIEYPDFAGFTGGAKALLPGVCGPQTLNANHAMLIESGAVAGRIQGNPVREDIEEAEALLGRSFLYNVVLDGERRIVEAVAGDVTLAHRQACQKVDEMYRVPLSQPADIVLASAGGWPKDVNLYQANKTLQNAAHAVRDGGIVILLAECREGVGNARLGEWLTCSASPEELFARIRQQFVLGAHVAVMMQKALRRGVRIFLVSALDPAWVRQARLEPYPTAQDALDAARQALGPDRSLVVMPHGGSTLPVVDTA